MPLLDTIALINLSRGPTSANRHRLSAVLNLLVGSGQNLCTSRVNEAEFRIGEFRVPGQAAKINAILASLKILELDITAVRR